MKSRSASATATLLAAFFCITPGHSAQRAVVVGIDAYVPGNTLQGCASDAARFAGLLKATYAFADQDIKILTNKEATRSSIVKTVEEHLIAAGKSGDVAVFYFAGHGTPTLDLDGDEADFRDETLLPADADDTKPQSWLPDDELAKLLARIPAARIVVVLDASTCGEGKRLDSLAESRSVDFGSRYNEFIDGNAAFVPDGLARELQENKKVVLLAACQPNQKAFELREKALENIDPKGTKAAGVFTSTLCTTLEKTPDLSFAKLDEVLTAQLAETASKAGLAVQKPIIISSALNESVTACLSSGKAQPAVADAGTGQPPPPNPPTTPQTPPTVAGEGTPASPPATPPTPATAPTPTFAPDGVITSGSIKLNLKTNGRRFKEGDKLTVELSAEKDCFVRLYYLSAEHKVQQIFPNKFQQENRLKAGQTITIPGATADFDFTMTKPYGNEVLKAVACATQFTDLQGDDWASQLFQAYDNPSLQSMSVRGIRIDEKQKQTPEIGEATLIYRVTDKDTPPPPPAAQAAPAAAPSSNPPAPPAVQP
ncbi:MAG: caspase family protein [Verrucomicrobiales bacterium]|nr:caspase family protein [Verrucomicrobiales bacterium]